MQANDEMKAHGIIKSCHPELKRLLIRASTNITSSTFDKTMNKIIRMHGYPVMAEHEKLYCELDYGTVFPCDTSDWLKPIADFCNSHFSDSYAPYNASIHFIDGVYVAAVGCKNDIIMFNEAEDSSIIALAKLCKAISRSMNL